MGAAHRADDPARAWRHASKQSSPTGYWSTFTPTYGAAACVVTGGCSSSTRWHGSITARRRGARCTCKPMACVSDLRVAEIVGPRYQHSTARSRALKAVTRSSAPWNGSSSWRSGWQPMPSLPRGRGMPFCPTAQSVRLSRPATENPALLTGVLRVRQAQASRVPSVASSCARIPTTGVAPTSTPVQTRRRGCGGVVRTGPRADVYLTEAVLASLTKCGDHCPVLPGHSRFRVWRRSTSSWWRRTTLSTSLSAVDRVNRAIQLTSRVTIRYVSRSAISRTMPVRGDLQVTGVG